MENHNIKAVIFDLGNVLVDFDHTIAARRIAAFSHKSAQEIFGLFFDSELTGLFEEGKITPQEFFLKVKDALSLKLGYATFVPIWNEIFFLSKKNREVYNIANSLSRHYKAALLSNINISHFNYLKKNFPVFNAFHHIITSYEAGLRKPHPLIYQKALQILESQAENVFYTDDRAELVEKASELGIRAFHFQSVDKLAEDLLSAGVHLD